MDAVFTIADVVNICSALKVQFNILKVQNKKIKGYINIVLNNDIYN